jgi:hypothetical protein
LQGFDPRCTLLVSSEEESFMLGGPLNQSRTTDRVGGVDDANARSADARRHADWLAGEIAASIDDPRPNIPHDAVMADLEADLAALPD